MICEVSSCPVQDSRRRAGLEDHRREPFIRFLRSGTASSRPPPQSRTANKQNEITSISGATTPTYDDNGNMTGDETGRQFVYDAWNRLVVVKNSGGTTLETFKYDGLNRRVSSDDGTTTTDLYYSSDWQVLSEKVGSNYSKRYVWSPVYVDAMVLRDRDTDSNGSLDERLWVQQDANWNVTALVNASGTVVERYAYDPYGVQTVYDASYTVRSGGTSYDFNHGFQGMWYDALAGLSPDRERWYSPTLQRFVTMDEIRYAAGDMDLYRVEGNNPSAYLDPLGEAEMSVSLTTKIETLKEQLSDGVVGYDIELHFSYPKADLAKVRRHWIQAVRNFSVIIMKDGTVINNPKNGEPADYNYVLDQSLTLNPAKTADLSKDDHRAVVFNSKQYKATDVLFYMQESVATAGLTKAGYKLINKGGRRSNISISKKDFEEALKWIDPNEPKIETKSFYLYYAGCKKADADKVNKGLKKVSVNISAWLRFYKLDPLGEKPFEYFQFPKVLKEPLKGTPKDNP